MFDITQIIDIDDVCIEKIAYVLSEIGLDAETLNNDQIWIKKEGSVALKIEVVERDKMLKFSSSTGLNESTPIFDKYKLADELNRALLVRFYIQSEGCLVGDYYLPYEHGVLTNQLLLICELFQYIFIGVLRDKFVEGGVLDV